MMKTKLHTRPDVTQEIGGGNCVELYKFTPMTVDCINFIFVPVFLALNLIDP